MGQRTAFRRSFSEGLAVFEMERKGKASAEFNRLAEALYPRGRKKAKNGKKLTGDTETRVAVND